MNHINPKAGWNSHRHFLYEPLLEDQPDLSKEIGKVQDYVPNKLQKYQEAKSYETLQNQAEAVKIYNELAIEGYAPAQFDLGICYAFGRGIKKSKSQATFWFQKAADQKHPGGLYNLAICYKDGWGVKKSNTIATELLTMAAKQGDPDAQTILNTIHS